MPFSRLLLFGCILVLAASCGTPQSLHNNYIQNVTDTTGKNNSLLVEPVIQRNDLLSIRVYSSSLVPQADAPYNLPETGTGSGTGTGTAGFLVDPRGNIEYPGLGTLHVEGLSKVQLADLIKSKLTTPVKLLENPSVLIRFLNYRVTVLGAVNQPGTYTVPTEKVTILEALGLAGDVSQFGRKTTVKVLRENGTNREIGTIDLSNTRMFESPYYNLQ
ncbi:MAG TPA: polysaccharide biosynthesis/export family protein, partial [Chitinophagaceae bacterium]|nr:polysaccharide biosynthesis/export family protein [Chitinophagaceae bacterium]